MLLGLFDLGKQFKSRLIRAYNPQLDLHLLDALFYDKATFFNFRGDS